MSIVRDGKHDSGQTKACSPSLLIAAQISRTVFGSRKTGILCKIVSEPEGGR